MGSFTLQLFGVDGTTVIAECSTLPSHARPYLVAPSSHSETRVELATGVVRTGQLNCEVHDVREDPDDQASGWFTRLLAEHEGLNGHRARMLFYVDGGASAEIVIDGPISTPRLLGYTKYSIEVKDETETAREVRAFDYTGTTTILPAGVLNGYGKMPDGTWLVPPTRPLRAIAWPEQYYPRWATLDVTNEWVSAEDPCVFPPDLYLTEAMQTINTGVWNAVTDGWGAFPGGVPGVGLSWPGVTILWRPLDSAEWVAVTPRDQAMLEWADAREWGGNVEPTLLKDMDAYDRKLVGRLPESETQLPGRGIASITLLDGNPDHPFPGVGEVIEVIVLYTGPATEAYPFHFDGTAGEYLCRMWRGDWTDGAKTRTARMDEAAILARFPERCIARIDEVVDDIREHIRTEWCAPLGAALTLDREGRVSPTRYTPPDADAALLDLSETGNIELATTWSHPDAGVINDVMFEFFRDQAAAQGRMPPEKAGDRVISRKTQVTRQHEESLKRFGQKDLKINTRLFRSLVRTGSQDAAAAADEVGLRLGVQRCTEAINRFAFGAQEYAVVADRAAIQDLRLGSYLVVSAKALPDYASLRRGLHRVAQVVGIRPVNDLRVELSLLDGGAVVQPLPPPASVAVALVGEVATVTPTVAQVVGVKAEVQYSLVEPGAPTPPPESGLWTTAGYTEQTAGLQVAVPAGRRLWARARRVGAGLRPSAWVTGPSVEVPVSARIASASFDVEVSGRAVLRWVANSATGGVRISVQSAARGAAIYDRPAGEGALQVPFYFDAGEEVTADIGGWTGYAGGAVSGSAGPPHPTLTARRPGTSADVVLTDLIAHTAAAGGDRLARWGRGAGVAEVWGAALTVDAPESEEKWEQVKAAVQPLGAADEMVIPAAGEGKITLVQLEPISAAGLIGSVRRMRIVGTPPPADFLVAFTESPDGLTSVVSLTAYDPRGVVTGADVFLTYPGQPEEGPHPALAAAPGTWALPFDLPPKPHRVGVRLHVSRGDGQPAFLLGPYTSDSNRRPDIPDVREQRDAGSDSVTLYVDCGDSDTSTLWRREFVGGVEGVETEIPPRGSDPRFGSFAVTASDSERRFHVYARNAAGQSGDYRDVRVGPYVPFPEVPQYAQVTARIVDADGETVTVQATGIVTGSLLTLAALTGSASLVAGPPVGMGAPSGSEWVFERGVFGAGPSQAEFTETAPGHVADRDLVVIPEAQRDTVALQVRATVLSSTAVAVVVRVAVADPYPGATVSLAYTASGLPAAITPASPQPVPGVTAIITGTGYVDFTVPRPASGVGRVSFTAAAGGRVSDSDSVDIPARQPALMLEATSETATHGTLTLTPVAGAAFDTVQFATQTGGAAWGAFATKAAPYTATVALATSKHPSSIAYRVLQGGVVVQERVVKGFRAGSVAHVEDASAVAQGATGYITTRHDVDTVTGAAAGEFGIDGVWTGTFVVDANREGRFSVPLAPVRRKVEVRGYNAAGAPGPWFPVDVPPLPPPSFEWVHVRVVSYSTGSYDEVHLTWATRGQVTDSAHQVAVSIHVAEAGGTAFEMVRTAAFEPASGTSTQQIFGGSLPTPFPSPGSLRYYVVFSLVEEGTGRAVDSRTTAVTPSEAP